jgi:glutathionylspermidine synthase
VQRKAIQARPHWRAKAREYGFLFHTLYGEPYWQEDAYYQFSLRQIEDDIETPTAELHQMCLSAVDLALRDCQWMRRFCIPETHWDWVAASWREQQPSLYSRLDLAYNGTGPAKLLENNADTPTSLYETGFWQWLWLEDQLAIQGLPSGSDQFNMLQEKLIARFAVLKTQWPDRRLHLSCCKDTLEDRGTVQYLADCAEEAGLETAFVYVEDIGLGETGQFTDEQDHAIDWMFKLYPWEFMLREDYADALLGNATRWLEPPWKSLVSNKAILPLLWHLFPQHPNLLPAFYEDDPKASFPGAYVKKPIFAREGANVSIFQDGQCQHTSGGPYGAEGFVLQAYEALPVFEGRYALVGSWLINDEPAGLSVREDRQIITQNLSAYLPHTILD